MDTRESWTKRIIRDSDGNPCMIRLMIDCMISLAGGSILWASRKPAADVVSKEEGSATNSFMTAFIHH